MTEDPAQRSRIMRAVRGKDTRPEMTVRRLAHKLGYRFRLHRADLPGKPDLVFPSRKKIVFVHGCFWHGHKCPRGTREPKANAEYWRRKISRNIERDSGNIHALRHAGWRTLIVWECEIKKEAGLKRRLINFLE